MFKRIARNYVIAQKKKKELSPAQGEKGSPRIHPDPSITTLTRRGRRKGKQRGDEGGLLY